MIYRRNKIKTSTLHMRKSKITFSAPKIFVNIFGIHHIHLPTKHILRFLVILCSKKECICKERLVSKLEITQKSIIMQHKWYVIQFNLEILKLFTHGAKIWTGKSEFITMARANKNRHSSIKLISKKFF